MSYKTAPPVYTTLPQPGGPTTLEDGVTVCGLRPPDIKTILSAPGFPQPIPRPPFDAYRIVEIPSKGLGMIATRDLKFGDLIVSERPLLLSTQGLATMTRRPDLSDAENTRIAMDVMEKAFKRLFDSMDPGRQKDYMALFNSHKHDGSGPIMGVVRTNSFVVDLKGDEYLGNWPDIWDTTLGVFKEISRCNHSCSPNVVRAWHRPSLSMQLYAARDIKRNEEIAVSYCDVLLPSSERQKQLVSYQMRCKCPACLAPAKSDINRHLIKTIQVKHNISPIISWISNYRLPLTDDLLKQVLELYRLMEIEGLDSQFHQITAIYYLIHIYGVLGDEESARMYARKWLALEILHHRAVESVVRFYVDARRVMNAVLERRRKLG